MVPESVIKRDGSQVPFDSDRVVAAIDRALQATGVEDIELARELGQVVIDQLADRYSDGQPGIEAIQDTVIYVLQESGNYDVALAYLRYRDARERQRRRRRLDGSESATPNLHVLGRDGRQRAWDRELIENHLVGHLQLAPKVAGDVVRLVEEMLADSDVTEISAPLMLSLVDAAMVRCGLHSSAEARAPLRVDRGVLRDFLAGDDGEDGHLSVCHVGEDVLSQYAIAELMPREVVRLYSEGRLWVDGLGDPLRGSQYTATLEGYANPWQIISEAFSAAVAGRAHWRSVRLILPPMIIGHLERGATGLIEPLEELGRLADVFLYCDGRTPLLEDWPFASKSISIASYAEDFLLLRRLQELGLEHQSGPHLMQGGYRKRVAVKLALNAQGLEDQFTQMDHLAMGLVAAAKMRQEQAARNPKLAGADIRFAIFGLPPNSSSNEYIERQVVQEGLRSGIALSRTTNLPSEACEHLGRLFA